MWVMTTDHSLVNIAAARRIIVEPSETPHTMVVRAYYEDGETLVLALASQRDDSYAESMASAYHRAIQEALRDGNSFCNLCNWGEVT